LMLPLLACSLPIRRQETRQVPPTVVISEQAAESFEKKIESAQNATESNRYTLRVTDEEITSYLNLRLQEQQAADVPIREPRVWFTDGKMYLSGKVQLESPKVSGQGLVAAVPKVVDGRVQVEISRASVGPVPVPRPLLQQITTYVNDQLAQVVSGVKVERIEILEGELLIEATQE
ncbi:MAG: hypothetical protein IT330_06540, partial [Anaerolineae bacterium]|nr:hypothetical protein [Anaerolineae bacterium]